MVDIRKSGVVAINRGYLLSNIAQKIESIGHASRSSINQAGLISGSMVALVKDDGGEFIQSGINRRNIIRGGVVEIEIPEIREIASVQSKSGDIASLICGYDIIHSFVKSNNTISGKVNGYIIYLNFCKGFIIGHDNRIGEIISLAIL